MLGLEIAGSDSKAVLDALSRSLAVIEFDPTGKVLTANENFCKTLGYDLSEIKGRHHSMFVEPEYARGADYREFWAKLGRGEYDAREYKRIGKGGREVWIQASYNPVLNGRGKVIKVVKAATDITAEKLRRAETEGKLSAISRAQAVIEFTTSGEILAANENFLNAMGYSLDEIKGRRHSMFVEPAYSQSAEYEEFWRKLNRGEFVAAEFKRIGKGGREVWIQASYNPIFDANGKVMKVVKFATDVTERVIAVNEIAAGLSRLADQDLEQEIARQFHPSFEKLRADFNRSVDKLRSAMMRITESAGTIEAGTLEIATASDDLSKRTEQQAASLEETAAALDEITTAVKKSAEGAAHARQVVATADQDAKNSAHVMRQAVEAMQGIAKSSTQISQIIGVIDEIAFQTNLLALNAGVEAARAGEAGRGFAVVASEVRALAQRSAEAAKEIKGLISNSSIQVESGVKLVAETGQSLERIMTQVADINNVISDIAVGAQEQATGLQQVNTAINQMDQTTQQNAAMVEQTTAAGHSLSQETTQLNELVGQFRIGTKGEPAARRQVRKIGSQLAAPARAAGSPRKSEPRAERPQLRAVAGGGSAASAEGWAEF